MFNFRNLFFKNSLCKNVFIWKKNFVEFYTKPNPLFLCVLIRPTITIGLGLSKQSFEAAAAVHFNWTSDNRIRTTVCLSNNISKVFLLGNFGNQRYLVFNSAKHKGRHFYIMRWAPKHHPSLHTLLNKHYATLILNQIV